MVQFLMHTHPDPPKFYLSRHGQSVYNACGKIGGDSELSDIGWEYARKLAEHTKEISIDENGAHVPMNLWTSTLRRTKETAAFIKSHRLTKEKDGIDWMQFRRREWRNLDEIYAGTCDGMTYAEIEVYYPDEFAQRQEHKLSYRYPRGESYLDLIHRLHNCILEMERAREPVLIVAHQAVLRILYAYWMGLPKEVAPTASIPLHTLIELTPQTYGCKESRKLLYAVDERLSLGDVLPGPAVPLDGDHHDHDPPSH